MDIISRNYAKIKSLLLSQKIDEKIIVFESDDWGSVRMPNMQTFNLCLNNGYPVDKNIYTKYDCLESANDIESLFNVISSYKDIDSNNPKFTTNFLVTNPDFNKIIKSSYKEYHFETILETYNKQNTNTFNKIITAYNSKLILPQLHGREHLNVSRMMQDLANNNHHAKFAIDNFMPGIVNKNGKIIENNYVVALENIDENDLESKKLIIDEGLNMFKNIFGYYSKSFIACNYTWNPTIESILNNNNVKFIQGSLFQLIPEGNYNGFKHKIHFLGETNPLGQLYLVRNAHFEPVYGGDIAVSSCMKQLTRAFALGLPGIISTHRINYVSGMSSENKENGIKYLNSLLKSIKNKWPEVKFMTSLELGEYLKINKK